MVLREYQLRCVDAVLAEWQKVQSTLVVACTGSGKTVVFGEIIRRMQPKRALVIAHRRELIEQAKLSIEAATGLECDVEMGCRKADDCGWLNKHPIVVASIQSLISGGETKRMHRWRPSEFGLIVIDEAHHLCAASYGMVLDYFKQNLDLKILGVTGTPDRADEQSLGQLIESVAFTYDVLDGIQDGWLVPITQQFCPVSGLDFSHVRTTCGDLNQGDLAKIMEAEENVQGICHPAMEVLYGLAPKTLSAIPVPEWSSYLVGLGKTPRRAIVFTVSVAQAEACCNIFNRVVPGIAEWVCGATEIQERTEILDRFKCGKTPVVCNCGILTEGFDAPPTEVIFMARPTKSRSLYSQCVGRSTRPLPDLVDGLATADERKAAIAASDKKRARIIDFCGNSGRHKLVCALDILGGKCSPEVIEHAIAKAKADGKPVTVLKQLSVAEWELDKRRKEAEETIRLAEEARKKRIVAKATFHHIDVDPFGQSRFFTGHRGQKSNGAPASEPQLKVIGRAGIPTTGVTKKKASWIIGILAKNDWRLPEQYQFLKKPAWPTGIRGCEKEKGLRYEKRRAVESL